MMVIDGVADVHDNVAGPAMLVVENDENHMVVKLILMMTARPGAPFQSCKTWSTHLGTEEEEEGGVVVVRYNV